MEGLNFIERVREGIIGFASVYKSVFLDYEHLIYSKDFKKNPYYIIGGNKDNYKHLTGVGSTLAPAEFFEKCLDCSIKESEIDFIKKGESEKEVKGYVRKKMKSLSLLSTFFANKLAAEEDFKRNRVECSFVTTENNITIGFVNVSRAIPKTLMSGNVLNKSNSVDISLVLRRRRNEDKFNEIISGDIKEFQAIFPEIYVNVPKIP